MPQSGYRPVTASLRQEMRIGKNRICRIMRAKGLFCRKTKKRKSPTTDSNHSYRKYPNLRKDPSFQDLPVIVGDVTAFDICGVTHFCAHLLDLENREAIGIGISDRLDTELVDRTLKMAITRRPSLAGYIHHTDSDSRYCSLAYTAAVKALEMEISMCVGNAYENAHSESFNRTLKRQEINIQVYSSKDQAAASILQFVDRYNRIRPHSALNMMTPEEFRKISHPEN